MMRTGLTALFVLLTAIPLVRSQISKEDAMKRLRERQAKREGTTLPSTTPTTHPTFEPTTRPVSMRDARRIVFLIEGRGSMLPAYSFVEEQTLRTIAHLRADQEFGIVVSWQSRPTVLEPPMAPPSEERRRLVEEFLSRIVPHGPPDLSRAIDMAIDLKPDFIWFSESADYGDDREVIQAFRRYGGRLNIALMDKDAANDLKLLLTSIAEEHGGICIDDTGKRIVAAKSVITKDQPLTRPTPFDARPSIFEQ
jgi:hypothetical protein